MNEKFNQWWNEDLLTENNPHVEGTPAFWAWEGWCAGVKAEREACARVCEQGLPIASSLSALDDMEMWGEKFAIAIRARGQA